MNEETRHRVELKRDASVFLDDGGAASMAVVVHQHVTGFMHVATVARSDPFRWSS